MDVKRVENSLSASVLPAFAVAAGAGLTGYTIPKMTDKAGNLDPFFHAYNAGNLLGSDVVQLNRAAYLDSLSSDITQKDIENLKNQMKNDKNFRADLADKFILQSESPRVKLFSDDELRMSKDEAKSLKTFVEKYLELSTKKQEKSNKELEKFVTWHTEELNIKPKDGERLKDAVKEFLKDKDAKAVRELLVPKTLENGICKNMEDGRYLEIVRETFDDVFDASTKKFKEGADKETVEFFKKSLKNFKMSSAKWYALIGGGFAFIGALSANLLNSDKK